MKLNFHQLFISRHWICVSNIIKIEYGWYGCLPFLLVSKLSTSKVLLRTFWSGQIIFWSLDFRHRILSLQHWNCFIQVTKINALLYFSINFYIRQICSCRNFIIPEVNCQRFLICTPVIFKDLFKENVFLFVPHYMYNLSIRKIFCYRSYVNLI